MSMTSDPYALLGVPRGATLNQIKSAHRALAKRYHPDSPTADAKRFLRVQEAYQLLSDPLRRREWDARHAPVRADQPTAPGPRAGRPSPARRPTEPPREQPSRSYTWSASEVPWWEEGTREARRSARPRRAGAAPSHARRPEPAVAGNSPGDQPAARNDFDVYSRSSGAAWSSAARAYFRRVDQDLPRRGSFHHQGSQPLTAARARVAAEEEARRRATRQETAIDGARADRRSPAAARAPRPASRAGESPSADARATVRPAYAHAGVARDADQITAVREMARERERAARWPSTGQRLRFAVLAWLPLALLIGYGGPHAAGCADPGPGCPAVLPAMQALAAAAVLVVLLVLPRLAFVTGVASAAVIVVGSTALLGSWLLGVRPPQAATLPAWAIVAGAAVLFGAYLAAAIWLLADRRRLPWIGLAGSRQ